MLPDNCSSLIEKITQSNWKKYWINQKLTDIKNPFKKQLIEYFNEFYDKMPIEEINERKYNDFLSKKLEKDFIENKINIQKCVIPIRYLDFKDVAPSRQYDKFIDFLAKKTFRPLVDNRTFELKKIEVAKAFIDIFEKYLAYLEEL